MTAFPASERAIQAISLVGYASFCVYGYVGAFMGWSNFLSWVYDHETLTAGFLAIASALLGAWFLHRQTTLASRQETDRIVRRREAIRTVLPLTLSEICRYAEESAGVIKSLLDQVVEDRLPVRSELHIPEQPDLPGNAVLTFKELVETFEVGRTASIAILLADLQVQSSRMSSALGGAGTMGSGLDKTNLEEYMLDCALIYSRSARLFDYARRAEDTMPVSMKWADVKSALRLFGLYSQRYESIFDTITRRSGGDLESIVEMRWSSIGR